MKIIQIKKVIELKKEIIEIKCDFCSCLIDKDKNGLYDAGFGYGRIFFGYPSKFDGNKYEFEICDSCFKKYFSDKIDIKNNKEDFLVDCK